VCLDAQEMTASIEKKDHFVRVVIAMNDERRLVGLTESFLDNVPDSSINKKLVSIPMY